MKLIQNTLEKPLIDLSFVYPKRLSVVPGDTNHKQSSALWPGGLRTIKRHERNRNILCDHLNKTVSDRHTPMAVFFFFLNEKSAIFLAFPADILSGASRVLRGRLRCSWMLMSALRDDSKNGGVADYIETSPMWNFIYFYISGYLCTAFLLTGYLRKSYFSCLMTMAV